MFSLKKKNKKTRGFTLIEMMVVLTIMILITTITMANYKNFGGKLLLSNTAYDLALSIREAQVYGISARYQTLGQFESAPVGVNFKLGATDPIQLFKEDNPALVNGIFDEGVLGKLGDVRLPSGFTIQKLCVTAHNGAEECDKTELHITFKRPEPDAIIHALRGISGGNDVYETAHIILQNRQADTMSILVEASGQISVQR